MPKLYAISDIHLGFARNREALDALRPRTGPESHDWLILAGDVGETRDHMARALEKTTRHFARVLWVPGNHELWTVGSGDLRGVSKYDSLVALCREFGVLTPEDPFPLWTGEGGPCLIAPLFLLYDYSFRPPEIPPDEAVQWARESGIVCADEARLHPDPYPRRQDWCATRCADAETRLSEAAARFPLVLINHFPLRYELVRLKRIPRFSIWCGTRRTEDWHRRFRALVVVSGHLHIRTTEWIDGVRFEEVSLGYPNQWRSVPDQGAIDTYLREILPGPLGPGRTNGPFFHS